MSSDPPQSDEKTDEMPELEESPDTPELTGSTVELWKIKAVIYAMAALILLITFVYLYMALFGVLQHDGVVQEVAEILDQIISF